ncbi:hypothetical protein BDW59DRAFT_106643 [Aspergillus cavernicola]|uniref:Uncharacterized protein n=1 Tax=Aspergillus cavernicola TaxID=176166 RepID=A0ABR4I315_9EURO
MSLPRSASMLLVDTPRSDLSLDHRRKGTDLAGSASNLALRGACRVVLFERVYLRKLFGGHVIFSCMIVTRC